jgi:hypothetical protein
MNAILGRTLIPAVRLALLGSLTVATSSGATPYHETWRCSARNGHFDRNVLSIPKGTTSIRGFINFHRPDFGLKWPSVARIAFTDSALYNAGCHCNGVSVGAFRDPDRIEFAMLTDGQFTSMAQSDFERPITFSISIDPRGMMTVQIGAHDPEIKTVMLSHSTRDSIIMSCSGSDVSFLNVKIQ